MKSPAVAVISSRPAARRSCDGHPEYESPAYGHPPGPVIRSLLGQDSKSLLILPIRIEELIDELRADYTIVIVTHSMQQAALVSQRTACFHLGIVIEVDDTSRIFTNPQNQKTQDYITGRFG